MLTNKIYCEYYQRLDKILFYATILSLVAEGGFAIKIKEKGDVPNKIKQMLVSNEEQQQHTSEEFVFQNINKLDLEGLTMIAKN